MTKDQKLSDLKERLEFCDKFVEKYRAMIFSEVASECKNENCPFKQYFTKE